MSWKQKEKTISSKQIIDSSISFDNLGCVKDQDDMSSDSATHIATQQSIKAYVDNKEKVFGASNNALQQSLTTTQSTVWTEFDIPSYTDARLHTAKFQIGLYSGSGTYRNDSIFYVTITVPSETTSYSLGTATFVSAPSTYVANIRFDGDITDKLTASGSIGLNLDSSSYFGDRTVRAFYYDNAQDYTFVEYSSYPSQIVADGSPVEIFFDPFHWASSGANFIIEAYDIEVPYYSQSTVQTLETRLGFFKEDTHYKLQAREVNSGDVLTISNLRHTLKTRTI